MTLDQIISLDERLDHCVEVLARLEAEYAAEKSDEEKNILAEKIVNRQTHIMILRDRLTHVYDDVFYQ